MSAHREADVIIVGGGIGGLAAALALARAGLAVRVLERSREFGEVGAGIQIAPNCTRILHEYGLLDEARQRGVLPENMVMRDALDAAELTRLDLRDLERRYGFPYMVTHRSDLHGLFLQGCRDAGVELLTGQHVTGYENTGPGTRGLGTRGLGRRSGWLTGGRTGPRWSSRPTACTPRPGAAGRRPHRQLGLCRLPGRRADRGGPAQQHRRGRRDRVRGAALSFRAVPAARRGDVQPGGGVRVGPAQGGHEDGGGPDELDAAFAKTCENVRQGIPLMWRDRWWGMSDRDPVTRWVHGRVALLGDAAHPPLQYIAQGAIMAIEDGWVLAWHARWHRRAGRGPDGTRYWPTTRRCGPSTAAGWC